jgi:hypothetical protein
MSPQQIVAVGARLLAALLVAHLPRELNQFYWLIATGVDATSASLLVFAAFALVFEVLLALALWFFPLTIARNLLPESPSEPPAAAAASPDIWLGMGCALIGLWLLTTSVPALLLNVYVLVGAGNLATTPVRHDVVHNVVYHSAEVAIALWLILGARGFRELFRWAQNAGVRKSPSEVEP